MAEHALSLDPQKVAEASLVDLGFMILKQTNKPYNYRDLMQEVARLKGLTDEQITEVIARLYTEINIDGRFVCIGQNVWGLKRWYPTEKTADKAAGGKKFVRKDVDEDDDFYDEEDDTFEEEEVVDDEPFADYDEDADEAAEEEFDDSVEEEEAVEEDLEDETDYDSFDEEEEEF